MQRHGIRLKATFYQVVQWVDEGSAGAEHNEGDEVKVIKFISEHVCHRGCVVGGGQCEDSGGEEARDGVQDQRGVLQG